MNPLIKLITIILIAIETSFVTNPTFNGVIIIASLLIIGSHPIHIRSFILLITIPFIPAIGAALAQHFYGTPTLAWVLFTRIYAYVLLGATFVSTTSIDTLAAALEQNLHLPTQLVFGILGAVHLIPQTKHKIITLQTAANLRGIHRSFLSPQLYCKAILAALQWSNQLSEAMQAHGFIEGAPRTHYHSIPLTTIDWLKALIIIIVLQLFL